jgi:hypothetical protein
MAGPKPPPRSSTSGSSKSDRNALVIWKPPCSAPVPASPDSCVSALAICCGEKLKMLAKPGGNVPPPAMKPSIAFPTLITFAGEPGGNSEVIVAGLSTRNTSLASYARVGCSSGRNAPVMPEKVPLMPPVAVRSVYFWPIV